MRTAMERYPHLQKEITQARLLRRRLGELGAAPVPRGLFRSLWQIPVADRRSGFGFFAPAGILATAVVAALGFSQFLNPPEMSPDEAARAAALQDFAITVAYLQKSAVVARNEMNEAVGSGVLNALAASRGIMNLTENGTSEGERNNVD